MNDSFSAARIHAMRSKLIATAEYGRLMLMSAGEVVHYLHSTEYREDIDALALSELDDPVAIDRVIAHNAQRTVEKLGRISGREHSAVLQVLLRENDIWNINLVADAITGGADPKEMLRQYARRGTCDPELFAGAKSIAELCAAASAVFPSLRSMPQTLPELRDLLRSESMRQHTGPLQQHLIDEENIIRLIMLKREQMPQEQIADRLVRGGTIKHATLRRAAAASDAPGALEVLRSTPYTSIMERALAQLRQGSIVRFEAELHTETLRRVRKEAITRPLHAELLLRYLADKDLEYENVRILVKGKQLGLDDDFIKQHMAI